MKFLYLQLLFFFVKGQIQYGYQQGFQIEPPEQLLNYEQLNFNITEYDDALWRQKVRVDEMVKLVGEDLNEAKDQHLIEILDPIIFNNFTFNKGQSRKLIPILLTLFEDIFKQELRQNYIYFLSQSEDDFYEVDNFGNPKFGALSQVQIDAIKQQYLEENQNSIQGPIYGSQARALNPGFSGNNPQIMNRLRTLQINQYPQMAKNGLYKQDLIQDQPKIITPLDPNVNPSNSIVQLNSIPKPVSLTDNMVQQPIQQFQMNSNQQQNEIYSQDKRFGQPKQYSNLPFNSQNSTNQNYYQPQMINPNVQNGMVIQQDQNLNLLQQNINLTRFQNRKDQLKAQNYLFQKNDQFTNKFAHPIYYPSQNLQKLIRFKQIGMGQSVIKLKKKRVRDNLQTQLRFKSKRSVKNVKKLQKQTISNQENQIRFKSQGIVQSVQKLDIERPIQQPKTSDTSEKVIFDQREPAFLIRNEFMRGNYHYDGHYDILDNVVDQYLHLYDINYPISFKDLNKLLLSLSLKYRIEDPCINCFRETKEEIISFFRFIDQRQQEKINSKQLHYSFKSIIQFYDEQKNFTTSITNDFMLKAMPQDQAGILDQDNFVNAILRALTEAIVMQENWFPIDLLSPQGQQEYMAANQIYQITY